MCEYIVVMLRSDKLFMRVIEGELFLCVAPRHGNATCKSQKLGCDNKYVLQELVNFLLAYMHHILNRPRGKRRGRGDCKCDLIKVLRLSGPFVFLLRLVEPL